MSHVLETDVPLTGDELRQVQTFADFLISRRIRATGGTFAERPGRVNVDAVAGMCVGMGGDKTDVQLVHEALDARAAKYMREG